MHKLTLGFTDDEADRLLYEALVASSGNEDRTPLTRQAKYLLAMALGVRQADRYFLRRIGVEPHGDGNVVGLHEIIRHCPGCGETFSRPATGAEV